MTSLSECGLSLTRLAYFFPSVVTDFPLSLLTWARVGNCKSSFILLCVLGLNLVLPERNILSPWWKKCWMYLEGILVVVSTSVGVRDDTRQQPTGPSCSQAQPHVTGWLFSWSCPSTSLPIASPGHVHKGIGSRGFGRMRAGLFKIEFRCRATTVRQRFPPDTIHCCLYRTQ